MAGGAGPQEPALREQSPSRTTARSSPEERAARGKEARERVSRERHADFEPSSARPDRVDLLEEQARTRLPDLVPIRYGRMSASPFAFYRGAALVMTSDLSTTPVSGLRSQICGDAHLSNFGTYATPERRLAFDIDDFDETAVGPWEWDVKRLTASVEVAGRDRGFSSKLRRAAVLEGVRSYRTAMREFASMPNLAVWYSRVDVDEVVPQIRAEVGASRAKLLDDAVAKSRTRDSAQAFSKLTERVGGRPRIVSDPPLIVPLRDLAHRDGAERVLSDLIALVSSYRRTRAIGGICSSTSELSTPRGRSSASEASARATGSCCCSAATTRMRCCSRPRRRGRRCWSASSAATGRPTPDNGSSAASG